MKLRSWAMAAASAAALLGLVWLGGTGDARGSDSVSDSERFAIPSGVTADGLTYGAIGDATSKADMPDLVATISDDGLHGYARFDDLQAAAHGRGDESAAEFNRRFDDGSTSVPLYAKDGVTVIGTFTLVLPHDRV